MVYLLVILFPLSMAGMCYILRHSTLPIILIAASAVLTQFALITQIPLDTPTRLLGVTLDLNALTRLFLVLFLWLFIVVFVASFDLPQGTTFIPISLLLLSLSTTILLLQDPFIVSLLLVGAALAAVLAIVDLPAGSGRLIERGVLAAALKYLVIMVLAGTLTYLSFILIEVYRPGEAPGRIPLARFMLALLVTGFALRLAIIPLHGWLPDLVEHTAPLVTSVVVLLLNSTSLLVLILTFQRFPVLLVENEVGLLVIRMASLVAMLLSGLLVLGQNSLRRTVAYVVIYTSSMIFYGLIAASPLGLTGAIFEAINQVLGGLLVLLGIGLIERPDGRPLLPKNQPRRDLLARWPIGGMAIITGLMVLLGVPPLSGYASKLLLYRTALEQSSVELGVLLATTVLMLLGAMRLIGDWLLGAPELLAEHAPLMLGETDAERPALQRLQPEPRTTSIMVVVLFLMCLLGGIYAQTIQQFIEGVIEGLTFVRIL